jgi:Domain of unknown function (DUF4105)
MHLLALALTLAPGLAPAPLVAPPPQALPQAAAPAMPVGERYQVFLLTMDQGDEIWERFGHNAILIRDRSTGQDLAWNWGLFDFQAPNFALRFIRGTMTFSMGPSELEPMLAAYAQANRSVYANEIYLTQEEAGSLDDFVRRNFAPENRDYVYDYFRDNCSTRTRDALDQTLGGVLHDQFASVPTSTSYRWYVHRLVHDTVWLDQGLSFLLGSRGDVPITEWEAMFIPMDMERLLENAVRPDGAGGTRPILGPRQVLFQADRPPTPDAPPSVSFWWLAMGAAGAAVLLLLGRAAHREKTWAGRTLAAVAIVWGLFSGILGSLLVTIWFTGHEFGYWNINLFYMSPFGLVLAVLAALVVFRGWDGPTGRRAWKLSVLVAGLSLLAAALQLATVVRQGNPEVVALALPIDLALALALTWVARGASGAVRPVTRADLLAQDL